ncbi:unnamed protein product [Adineta steineri]|uniref:Uncharacterized protein n=1 Tax=Adineta steineri TaxID=433720 RepID=A0A815SRG3_9BILA|nr:unnamed protein product [Adineta steineri]
MNGRMKQFKYFDKIIPNSALPYVHDYLQITCSINNAFRSPYVHDYSDDIDIAKLMLDRKNKINLLEDKLANKTFLKAKSWKRMEGESTALTSPLLSKEDIKRITMGIFQIKQALSYVNEHIDEAAHYEV